MKALWHIALISFRPDAPEEIRKEIFDQYQTLAEDCGGRDTGILFWKVAHNLDLRKNVHLVEIAVFKDDAALQAFRGHPKHKELTDVLSKVADWWVGDVYQTLPNDLITETPSHEAALLDGVD